MLDEDDLEAAVAEGIVMPAQIEALRLFVTNRRRTAERADEERFRFMRGFNDFFFAVGIVLFGSGVAYFADLDPIMNMLAAAIIWGLAEFMVGRMRLVLPGILLACLFAFFIFRMTRLDWSYIAQLTGLPFHLGPRVHTDQDSIFGNLEPIVVAGRALAAGLAATAFYARFRLPFALLVIAGSVVLFVSMIFSSILSSGSMTGMLILLGCGFGVFAVAMAYDLSDRTRTTRNADCAFWLHLLAAPLIVHSLIKLIVPASDAVPVWQNMTTTSAIAIYVIVAMLTAIAVLIDRRALLVSALSYLGIAIGYAVTGAVHAGADRREVVVFFATLLILGALVLVLGVGWQPLRRIFLRPFPSALVERLPPAVYPA